MPKKNINILSFLKELLMKIPLFIFEYLGFILKILIVTILLRIDIRDAYFMVITVYILVNEIDKKIK